MVASLQSVVHTAPTESVVASLTMPLRWPETSAYLERVISRFGLNLQLQTVEWGELWPMVSQSAFTKKGAVVAEIGSTWLQSLVGMHALKPINKEDALTLGGEAAYVKAAWDSCHVRGNATLWSIPWSADVRVIYFWRDMLEAAGVNPQFAFDTHPHMMNTLEQLREAGYETPWVVETSRNNNPLENAASWLWKNGGCFVSQDGRRAAFTAEPALNGLMEYFSLLRYYPAEAGILNEGQANTWFAERKAAVTMSGPWLLNHLSKYQSQDMLDVVGIALPPGPSFVGGTHLAVMAHISPKVERQVMELCLFLGSENTQRELIPLMNVLPVRKSILRDPFYAQNPHLSVMVQALKHGKLMPNVPRWTIIEDRLMDAFAVISQDILQQGSSQISQTVDKRLKTVAARLNMVLSQ